MHVSDGCPTGAVYPAGGCILWEKQGEKPTDAVKEEMKMIQMCIRDSPEMDPKEDNCFITIRQENGKAVKGRVPLGYFGDLETEYEKRNQDYIKSR